MSYQSEFARVFRVGVIGVGGHSYRNLLPVLHYLPVRLVGICGLDTSRLSLAAGLHGAQHRLRQCRLGGESPSVDV